MERPERYDPEDLEHLMLERPFDELLAEEQVFALRHLQDRAEYERMRALLHQVQQQRKVTQNRDADPAVRERVLAAFRAEQQPRWRIWLNGVGAFLLPGQSAAYWRPALALGLVAVVVITVVRLSTRHDQAKVLAEARPATTGQQLDTPAPAAVSPESVIPPPEASVSNPDADLGGSTAVNEEARSSHASTRQQINAASTSESPVQAKLAEAHAIMDTVVAGDMAAADLAMEERAVAKRATTTRAEFASGAVVASEAASMPDYAGVDGIRTQDQAQYTEDDLLGLLQAAW
ncbi:MAG: hypothetical protein M9900_03030 [Flavobacteriales bacterium]|nr:hypothetical protein [Flavobacteriales bacterium]